jgi:hypothetical protein
VPLIAATWSASTAPFVVAIPEIPHTRSSLGAAGLRIFVG